MLHLFMCLISCANMADAVVLLQEYLPLGHMRKRSKAPASPAMGNNGKAAPAAAATPAGPAIAEERSVHVPFHIQQALHLCCKALP